MNTPTLETKRLILRKFNKNDAEAIFKIYSDREVNRFLPWYPLESLSEAEKLFEEKYAAVYSQQQAYAYAICLNKDNYPIGYINIGMDDSHDLGYGLRKEFWHLGIVSEAGKAVAERAKNDGFLYITATHDVNNLRSGYVMQRLGMKYCYSYEEQWQPKDFLVTFRMYQLNFDGNSERVYKKYWDNSKVRFVESF